LPGRGNRFSSWGGGAGRDQNLGRAARAGELADIQARLLAREIYTLQQGLALMETAEQLTEFVSRAANLTARVDGLSEQNRPVFDKAMTDLGSGVDLAALSDQAGVALTLQGTWLLTSFGNAGGTFPLVMYGMRVTDEETFVFSGRKYTWYVNEQKREEGTFELAGSTIKFNPDSGKQWSRGYRISTFNNGNKSMRMASTVQELRVMALIFHHQG
jgi:hypothetical protein